MVNRTVRNYYFVVIVLQTTSEDTSTMSGYNEVLYPLDNFMYCLDQELLSRNANTNRQLI